MKSNERIPSFFFLALSLFICQQSVVIGVGSLSQPGPGLLAFGAGTAMGGLALGFLIQSFVSKERQSKAVQVQDGTTLGRGRFLLICISLFAYTLAAKWLGFLIATFVFTLFIFYMIESKKWWRMLIDAALITIGNHLFFVQWLGLSLPTGLFNW